MISSASPATAATSTSIKFVAIRDRLEHFPLSIIQLAMRVGVRAIFLNAGAAQIPFVGIHRPTVQGRVSGATVGPRSCGPRAMVQELTLPILLFAGLATRLATIPFLGMLAVIQIFVYPNAWAEHLVWGSILLFLLTRGPGVFSLDFAIARRLRARRS